MNKIFILLIFLIMFSINTVAANDKITLFSGSSLPYNNFTEYIIYHSDSYNINLLTNRYVEFWHIKNGNLINKQICHNFNVCKIENIEIEILHIFFGREASMVQFKIIKIYR